MSGQRKEGRVGVRPYRLGLLVGKFAPLHRGHERLFAAAQSGAEQLLVLSYSNPELPRCSPELRRRWLQERYPQHECHVIDAAWLARRCAERGIAVQPLPHNHAPADVQQHYLAWLLRDVLQRCPDAMFAGEAYVMPCAQVLSTALAHNVNGVLVDRHLDAEPVSASAIRADPCLHWQDLSPPARAAFVRRVAVLGGESSGKSTLAAALAQALGTVWAPEYGRQLWEQRNGRLDPADLITIAHEQIALEERLSLQARGWLFCDTTPLTTFGYQGWMFGDTASELETVALREYDAIVLCAPDFGFVQDGTRRGEAFRTEQHAWYVRQLAERSWDHLLAVGGVEQRVAQVREWLSRVPS